MEKSKPLLDGAKGKGRCTDFDCSDTLPHHSFIADSSPDNDDDDKMSPTPPNELHVGSIPRPTKPSPLPETPQALPPPKQHAMSGLRPPRLNNTAAVTGATTPRLRIENKRRRKHQQAGQPRQQWWKEYQGTFDVPSPCMEPPTTYRNNMCPRGLALSHPAADHLLQYASKGCPVHTGTPWTIDQMRAAIERGPHISALVPDAMAQLDEEVKEKVQKGQARIVKWKDVATDPPPQLKISPVAMVPHSSRPYRAILDLSFLIQLTPNTAIPSVNSTTTKSAPRGAIDQIGHVLPRIIHAFATAEEDAKIFMAKWDIKDGFWCLDCETGEEWNFAYVLPSTFGTEDVALVIPTSLQMGWIESPPYFCVASETARDVAASYAELPLGAQRPHDFLHYTTLHEDYQALPRTAPQTKFRYIMEVYMDDFIDIAIPTSQRDLDHLATATMNGIHDVFPRANTPAEDPISERKLKKLDGAWANVKEILGMTFDGVSKTIWLSDTKQDKLLATLKQWIRHASRRRGIPFSEFRTTLSKLQHAFLTVPAGKGLLSAFYVILAKEPRVVHLHSNHNLRNAVKDCRTFLRETIASPTRCKNLVAGWPDYVGITDASGHGLGGVIVGERKGVPPTVFRLQWPEDITRNIISDDNPTGTLTNSDLEMAGLLMLWLVMEDVCDITDAHVALFSDNSPTVHWVQRLAAKHSEVAMQLIRALAFLRLQLAKASPLTPMHIAGVNNSLTDIPSRSFGSDAAWHCKTDNDLLTLFNSTFPLPTQASWTVYHISSAIATRVISILQMKVFTADEWRRLPKKGGYIGTIGSPMSTLWEWTHTFNKRPTNTEYVPCLDLPPAFEWEHMADGSKYALERSIALSQPLARRSLWPEE